MHVSTVYTNSQFFLFNCKKIFFQANKKEKKIFCKLNPNLSNRRFSLKGFDVITEPVISLCFLQ